MLIYQLRPVSGTSTVGSVGDKYSTLPMYSGADEHANIYQLFSYVRNGMNLIKNLKNKVKNLKVGDTVILSDDKLPRNSWPLGRVVETYPGSDGLIRSVKITTKSASAPATLVRPIHKLCLLESVNA